MVLAATMSAHSGKEKPHVNANPEALRKQTLQPYPSTRSPMKAAIVTTPQFLNPEPNKPNLPSSNPNPHRPYVLIPKPKAQ